MKKIILLAIITLGSIIPIHAQKANSIPIDAAHFPDEIFRDYIRAQFDLNHDGILSKKERLQVEAIDIYGFLISTLDGISYFTNLKSLNCSNNPITSLDMLKDCYNLQILTFGLNHRLSSVDLSGCVNLQSLSSSYNSNLQTLNLSGCVNLQSLYCQYNRSLNTLVLNGCANLTMIRIEDNPNTSSLNVNECTKLFQLLIRNNNLSSISLQNCTSLYTIWCDSNQLTSLDLSASNNSSLNISFSNNKHYILQNENHTFDLNQLPNFDINKADNWDGGFLTESTLTFIKDTVSYDYDLSHPSGVKARFMLISTTEIPKPSDDTEDDDIDDYEDPIVPNIPENPGEDPDDDPEVPEDPDDDPETPENPDDDPDEPEYPITGVQPVAEAPAHLFSVHPVPFNHTLHIKTALRLQNVCLYNMQGRLCARFEHGFDALPTADLEPGLYLLLLETADGTAYRLKAIKE